MKKRIFSLLLVLLLTVFPTCSAFAQNEALEQSFSEWALEDLIVGDTYNIYPLSWYERDMRAPISNSQLRVLMAGVRSKLHDTDSVIDHDKLRYSLSDKMTVEKVLDSLYMLITEFEFSSDIAINDDTKALDYMTKYNIYTAKDLALQDICSIEQACVFATRLITHLYDALDASSKGFLWEIESGENKVYLLGSVHLANYDIYPFSNKMLEAFAESDVLGVEINVLDESADVTGLYMQYGMYMDGTSLIDHVSEETYIKVMQIGEAFGLGEETLAYFKPWVLFNTFASLANTSTSTIEEAALSSQLGIDMKFLIDAYFTNKTIIELESFELQMKMLDSFSDELEELLLVSTLDSIIDNWNGVKVSEDNTMDVILDYWHEGDVEGFMENIAPILVASETSNIEDDEDVEIAALLEEYYNKMLTERDRGMAEKIDGFLKAEGSATYFVVVGTSHYISDYSIIDILEEMGYEINQIK